MGATVAVLKFVYGLLIASKATQSLRLTILPHSLLIPIDNINNILIFGAFCVIYVMHKVPARSLSILTETLNNISMVGILCNVHTAYITSTLRYNSRTAWLTQLSPSSQAKRVHISGKLQDRHLN